MDDDDHAEPKVCSGVFDTVRDTTCSARCPLGGSHCWLDLASDTMFVLPLPTPTAIYIFALLDGELLGVKGLARDLDKD